MVKRTKRANGTGSIEKARNGSYTVRVYTFINGVRKRITIKSGCESYKKAERFLNDYILAPYELDSQTLTFKELYNQFIKYKKADSITENTLKNYQYAFKRCINLHNEKIKDLTKPKIQLFINTLKKKNGEPASDGTKSNTKIFLTMLFDFAKDNRLINDNVASFRTKRSNFEKVKEINIFTKEEIKTLWENVDKCDWVDIILIMLYTGVRFGEIQKMKVENIDLINGKILHSGNKTSKGKNRTIFIKDEIKELVKNRCVNSPTGYLAYGNFKIESRIKPKEVGSTYFRKKFNEVMDLFGMRHTPHDTRHTFITALYLSGASDKAIENIAGHTNIEMTEKYYVHLSNEDLKKQVEKLDYLN